MTPLVFRTTEAIDCDVLAAATLRVDRDEEAAAANEVEFDVRADWDICCCWMCSAVTEGDEVDNAKDDEEGCCAFRLTPQIDFGNTPRSSDLGLSSVSPPKFEGALAAVVSFFVVESDCSTWEECG
jgi:hypothetical protein